MEIEIDNYPVSQLQSRYGIGKQAVYNRLDTLDIKPFKEGNRSFISPDQVRSLDQLHEHILAGGKMADFSPVDTVDKPSVLDQDLTSQLIQLPESKDSGLIDQLRSLLAHHAPPADPLWYMPILERAKASEWLISTSQIKRLIGVEPRCKKGKKTFTYGSFVFAKSGKMGRETAWRVMKVQENSFKY